MKEKSSVITFTEAAINHFLEFLKKTDGIAIKIGIKVTGCSGFGYSIESISHFPENFIKIKKGGVQFVVDPKALEYIKGLKIDYLKKELGLSQLIYNNPNEVARCGCGESFTVN